MPALNQTVSVTARTEHKVRLSTKLKTKVVTALKTYAGLNMQKKLIEAQLKEARDVMGEVLEEIGEASLKVDDYGITLVAPIRKRLDEKKLLAAGVTMAQIKAATVEEPTTPYVRVSVPRTLNDVTEEDE